MRRWKWRSLLLCLALIGALLSGGCTPTGNPDLPELKVLFIGNSFTFYNDGIDQTLRGLAPRTKVDRATEGGYTLGKHLADRGTIDKLQQGDWTHVVLQEQSQYPVYESGAFIDSAQRLSAEVRKTGATPLLLMTWARPDSPGVTTKALNSAFSNAGKRLKLDVIPAGVAFGASLAEQPGIVLNKPDGHPTREGTYLAACVVYATLFGESPVGNSYTGGLDAEVAFKLQEKAGQAVRG